MPLKRIQPGVYVQEVPSGIRTIQGVSTSVTVFVGPTTRGWINQPVQVRSFVEFERRFGGLSASMETGFAVRQFFLNGGTDAVVVRVASTAGLSQIEAALGMLRAVDLFNVLVLPGVTDPTILETAAMVCEARRAMLLIDAPVTGASGADPVGAMTAAIQGAALPRSANAAVYFPWLLIADPFNPGATRLAPPSGTIAGLYARTDSKRGVWKAPAGTDARLAGVAGVACTLSDAQTAVLTSLGVNCVRSLPTHGIVCWGARTLHGGAGMASEWKYVPVRRLALFIEESLDRGMRWVVFEPNDEPLWAQVRLNVNTFLNGLFRAGAFAGVSQREACFVKCDQGTMTQADIASGLVNVLVGFAPLKPAEFVVLKIQLKAGR